MIVPCPRPDPNSVVVEHREGTGYALYIFDCESFEAPDVHPGLREARTISVIRILCTLNPLPPKNQMAHEVTRDVTAWAFISFRRQSWYRTDSLGNLLPGLGPPRSAQHETTVACHFIQTVGSRQSPPRSPAQQGGMAVSRLDGRGLSLSRARS